MGRCGIGGRLPFRVRARRPASLIGIRTLGHTSLRQRPDRCTVHHTGHRSPWWLTPTSQRYPRLEKSIGTQVSVVCLHQLEVSDSHPTKEANREAHLHLLTTQIVSEEPACSCTIMLTRHKEKNDPQWVLLARRRSCTLIGSRSLLPNSVRLLILFRDGV